MEILFIQLSDYLYISISKNLSLWLVLCSRVTFIYLFILCFKNDYSENCFFMIQFFSQMSRIITKNYKLHFKIRKEIDKNYILL